MESLKEILGGSAAGLTTIWLMVKANKKKIEDVKKDLKRELHREIEMMKEYVNTKHDSVEKKLDGIDKKIDKLFERIFEIVKK